MQLKEHGKKTHKDQITNQLKEAQNISKESQI